MIATGYVRRSAKSEDNTVSLQEQRRQIEHYCASKGFALAAVVTHDGVSGAKRSRWDEIRRTVKETGSGVLIIYNLDRLSRDAAGLLDNLRYLAATGVEVHEVSSGALDLKRATSKFTVGLRGLADEFFRDVVSEKTRDALRYKRENGQQYTHLPPLGFAYAEGRIVENPHEQAALVIVDSCRAQGLGARLTIKKLVAAGYRGRMGISTIHRLLHADIKRKLPASYFAPTE